MAPIRCIAKFDHFLSFDCVRVGLRPLPPPWRNPRKGRDQILPSGNHVRDFKADRMEVAMSVNGVFASSVFLRNDANGLV